MPTNNNDIPQVPPQLINARARQRRSKTVAKTVTLFRSTDADILEHIESPGFPPFASYVKGLIREDMSRNP